jgi:hypothetical protein
LVLLDDVKASLAKVWRFARWPLLVVLALYAALVIYRIPAVGEKKRTAEAVARIHAQKITLDDVMGKNLPPAPDPASVDATVAGVDANKNNIRDDVELAILKKYPSSARIRAAELQYAMAEQMYLTQVFNTETWKAVAEETGRANICMSLTKANEEYVESLVFNTPVRKQAQEKAFEFITSHGSAAGTPCDISPE